ncbi:hypothetical protein [Bacillus suaedaesalsae]|uniref:Radical SAM protein n=1 Tax=Bacillus suaedaesalsae TaxID=2810349 RepID=A0ABS2DGB7_9BACI|nr:hypothetical protein [Bacillus suaedaesalsae]MBM6617461.1 hypothetical protein [Bacillus suaedaesalsae]
MTKYFLLDNRLGIELPHFEQTWEEYSDSEQQEILTNWETIRGKIPDRIAELESIINEKQHQLGEEDDFIQSCILNSEISDLASIINDLWLWYRLNQNVTGRTHF